MSATADGTGRGAASIRLAPAGGHGNAERARERDPFRIRPDELAAWTRANERAREAYYAQLDAYARWWRKPRRKSR